MLADTAVAVNPNDDRYTRLVGQPAVLPLVGRRLPIIADEHVDPEFGTGALKITPGHDPNDFEIGRRHGLEEISVIGEDGRMTDAAGERFAGLTVAEAREASSRRSTRSARSRGASPTSTRSATAHRSGQPIEPLISLQWFCRMDELAAPAIEAVESDRVRSSRRPLEARAARLDAERSGPGASRASSGGATGCRSGTATSARRPTSRRRGPTAAAPATSELRQETDVLDTWFSSQLWPFAVLGWPDDTPELRAFYPTDFLTTAREILYLWVARMIMMGIEFADDVPFDDVYVHSVDPRARRAADVEEPRHRHRPARGDRRARRGRAALRPDGDVVEPGRPLLDQARRAGPRPRQQDVERVAARAAEHEPTSSRRRGRETVEDRWILSRLQRAIAQRHGAGRAPTTSRTRHSTSTRFFWSEFCDWYLEMVKPRLYESRGQESRALGDAAVRARGDARARAIR